MSHPTRRNFLKEAAALGLGATLYGKAVAANEKLGVACIGVRGRGNALLNSFAAQKDCRITHICDIRQAIREQRGDEIHKKHGYKPELVNDYRTILENKAVDLLVVGTPDHWHALPTIHGCLAGKDVYVEKPCSHNIAEGRTMVAAARKRGRMVQVGTQLRSAPFLKEAAEYVKSGALGKVIYGRSWETDHNREWRLGSDGPVPAGVDYDLWLGPVSHRPFNNSVFSGGWRWRFDFGTGDLGNDGVHRIDYCRMVMGIETMPQAINASGGLLFFKDDQQFPDTLLVNYEYPGAVITYEMRLWSNPKLFDLTEGAAVYGENGWILMSNTFYKAFDAKGKLVKQGTSDMGLVQQLHTRNLLEAVGSRKHESLNQDVYSGHVSTAMCHAGNIAWRVGKKLRYDASTDTFDDKEANQLVGRQHRKGFELPAIT